MMQVGKIDYWGEIPQNKLVIKNGFESKTDALAVFLELRYGNHLNFKRLQGFTETETTAEKVLELVNAIIEKVKALKETLDAIRNKSRDIGASESDKFSEYMQDIIKEVIQIPRGISLETGKKLGVDKFVEDIRERVLPASIDKTVADIMETVTDFKTLLNSRAQDASSHTEWLKREIQKEMGLDIEVDPMQLIREITEDLNSLNSATKTDFPADSAAFLLS